MGDRNAYQREYNARRYLDRVAFGVKRLGSVCRHCGSSVDLEFDHVDPSQKAFEVTAKTWMKLDRWLAEVDKCQLLCRPCHVTKSIADAGQTPAVGRHGTLSSYRYCKCDACRSAKSVWQANYMAKRRAGSIPAPGTNIAEAA